MKDVVSKGRILTSGKRVDKKAKMGKRYYFRQSGSCFEGSAYSGRISAREYIIVITGRKREKLNGLF